MNSFNNFNNLSKALVKKIEGDLKGFKEVSKYKVEYGIPEGSVADGENISDYAKLVDFGSPALRIPSRPWLSSLKEKYFNEIKNDVDNALKEIKNNPQKEVKDALERNISFKLINYMRDNILNGGWIKNSQKTIKLKGSSTPLINEGNMLRSVNSFATKEVGND